MAAALREALARIGSDVLRRVALAASVGGALASATLFVGCGDAEPAAETGNFEVAGADDAAGAEGSAAAPSGASGDGQPTEGPATSVAAAPGPGGTAAGQTRPAIEPPPSLAVGEFRTDPVPQNATAAQLSVYLKSLRERENSLGQLAAAMSRDELRANIIELQRNRLAAAKALLETPNAEETARQSAIDYSVQAYQMLGQVGEDIETDFPAFLAAHAEDRDPVIVRFTRSMLTSLKLQALVTPPQAPNQPSQLAPQEQVDAAMADLDSLLTTLDPNPTTYAIVSQAAMGLASMDQDALALQVLRKVGDVYSKSDVPEIKLRGDSAYIQAEILELGVPEALAAVEQQGDEAAAKRLVEIAQQFVGSATPANVGYLGALSQFADTMELVGMYEQALAIHRLVGDSYGSHPDAESAEQAKKMSDNGVKRLTLVGSKVDLTGLTLDGKPFDWASYRGKVVLIDFWATWCGPCLQELPNVLANYRRYHPQGFEVVGVNIDDDVADVKSFLAEKPLPWTTIVTDDPEKIGFESPMAAKFGVNGIPFVVLVDAEGVVKGIHVRGSELGRELAAIYGAPGPGATGFAPPTSFAPPGVVAPEATSPVATPADAGPAAEAPAGDGAPVGPVGNGLPELAPLRSSRLEPTGERTWFVGVDGDEEADDETAVDDGDLEIAEEDAVAAEEATPAPAPPADENLFLASPDLTLDELVEFVFDMDEKPRAVQALRGFDDAVIDACDRIWRSPDATVPQLRLAVTTKMKRLHGAGMKGDVRADERLAAYADRLGETPDDEIAQWVTIVRMERKALAGSSVPLDQLPETLEELRKYSSETSLDGRHLRLASLTVRLINRYDDPAADEERIKELSETRESEFKAFGDLFAKSENKELSRYGKKLAEPPKLSESDLVGSKLELAGDVEGGGEFDWASYRGKVVIVDFWATWCGPCVAEMPNVRAAYDRLGDQGLEVVGVSLDDDLEALAAFLEENQVPWQTLSGESTADLADRYGVRGIPTMMLIDREGTILMVGHQVGPLAKKAEELLAK